MLCAIVTSWCDVRCGSVCGRCWMYGRLDRTAGRMDVRTHHSLAAVARVRTEVLRDDCTPTRREFRWTSHMEATVCLLLLRTSSAGAVCASVQLMHATQEVEEAHTALTHPASTDRPASCHTITTSSRLCEWHAETRRSDTSPHRGLAERDERRAAMATLALVGPLSRIIQHYHTRASCCLLPHSFKHAATLNSATHTPLCG